VKHSWEIQALVVLRSERTELEDSMVKDRLKVVGLGGSLAQQSTSLAALRIALEGAAEAGATTELLDIKELSLPMYDPANENPPHSVRKMCDSVYEADGLIWSSPMYNGTISGSFKNALDWLKLLGDRKPPYLTDKVVGLISTAGGVQGLQAVNTMEFVVRALRGWAVPLVMPIAQAWKAFDEKGIPQERQLAEQLHALGREVVRGSCQFALEPPTKEDAARAEAELAPISDSEAEIA
jgi:FMN reductase